MASSGSSKSTSVSVGQIVEERFERGLDQGREGLGAGRHRAAQQGVDQRIDLGRGDRLFGGPRADRRRALDHAVAVE